MIDPLIRWGADIDHRAAKNNHNPGERRNNPQRLKFTRLSALAYTIRSCDTVRYGLFRRRHRAVAIALLRGGASLDSAVKYTVVDAQGEFREDQSRLRWVPKDAPSWPAIDYLAFKAFLLSVRAAGGHSERVIEQSSNVRLDAAPRDLAAARRRTISAGNASKLGIAATLHQSGTGASSDGELTSFYAQLPGAST